LIPFSEKTSSASGVFRPPPKALTKVNAIEAEAELKALQRHALELVDPETGTNGGYCCQGMAQVHLRRLALDSEWQLHRPMSAIEGKADMT
jgi:hypothetical protein